MSRRQRTRWHRDPPALRLVDSDPAQTGRIRAWREANPEWTLTWEHGYSWRLSDGRSEFTGLGWAEVLRNMDRLSSAAPAPRPGRTAAGAVAAIRPFPEGPPDILA